jgi:hypothetical protein
MLAAVLASIALASALAGCFHDSEDRRAGPALPPNQPAPGAYRYSTSGFETVDALLGARHNYAKQTRVRVATRPCGYTERWFPRRERWVQFGYCVAADGARRLRQINDFHEFFGYPVTRNYRCKGASVPSLESVQAGFSWTDRCHAKSTSLILHGRIVGRRKIDVEGAAVDTVHLKVVARSRGRSTGTSVNDYWLAMNNGLLVRRIVHGDAATRTPIGKVRSSESYRLRLRSLDPG